MFFLITDAKSHDGKSAKGTLYRAEITLNLNPFLRINLMITNPMKAGDIQQVAISVTKRIFKYLEMKGV